MCARKFLKISKIFFSLPYPVCRYTFIDFSQYFYLKSIELSPPSTDILEEAVKSDRASPSSEMENGYSIAEDPVLRQLLVSAGFLCFAWMEWEEGFPFPNPMCF